jgi:hypothetical protein
MRFTFAGRTTALVAVPVLLMALTACNSGTPARRLGAAAPAGIATSTAAPTAASSPTAGDPTPSASPSIGWNGTTQFLQIKSSEVVDNVEYLEVRLAEKNAVGDNFETVTLGGPWTRVEISAQAENVPLKGIGGDAGQLTAALAERSAKESDEGFDVTFDKNGLVRKVTWIYVSARERASVLIARWAGSTQFLQIKSARKRGVALYLKVRPAEKEYLGESFETRTTGGPWTEVQMSALAENVPLGGIPGDAEALRKSLSTRPANQADEGFDISFFGNGQVSKVAWLYVPSA